MNERKIRGSRPGMGEHGYCHACDRDIPDGHDLCLGLLPGVSQACCGHGLVDSAGRPAAYVVIGGNPDEPVYEMAAEVTLRGHTALAYFRDRKVGPAK